MKHFSIPVQLEKKDYILFRKAVNRSVVLKRLRFAVFILFISLIFVIFGLYSLGVTAFFLLFILFFLGDVVNYFYVSDMNAGSKIGRRKEEIEFYSDHIQINYLPDENFKGSAESHYPLGSVKIVMENKDYFYFGFEDNFTAIIPKRFVDSESYEKIKYMINNLYPDRFLEE